MANLAKIVFPYTDRTYYVHVTRVISTSVDESYTVTPNDLTYNVSQITVDTDYYNNDDLIITVTDTKTRDVFRYRIGKYPYTTWTGRNIKYILLGVSRQNKYVNSEVWVATPFIRNENGDGMVFMRKPTLPISTENLDNNSYVDDNNETYTFWYFNTDMFGSMVLPQNVFNIVEDPTFGKVFEINTEYTNNGFMPNSSYLTRDDYVGLNSTARCFTISFDIKLLDRNALNKFFSFNTFWITTFSYEEQGYSIKVHNENTILYKSEPLSILLGSDFSPFEWHKFEFVISKIDNDFNGTYLFIDGVKIMLLEYVGVAQGTGHIGSSLFYKFGVTLSKQVQFSNFKIFNFNSQAISLTSDFNRLKVRKGETVTVPYHAEFVSDDDNVWGEFDFTENVVKLVKKDTTTDMLEYYDSSQIQFLGDSIRIMSSLPTITTINELLSPNNATAYTMTITFFIEQYPNDMTNIGALLYGNTSTDGVFHGIYLIKDINNKYRLKFKRYDGDEEDPISKNENNYYITYHEDKDNVLEINCWYDITQGCLAVVKLNGSVVFFDGIRFVSHLEDGTLPLYNNDPEDRFSVKETRFLNWGFFSTEMFNQSQGQQTIIKKYIVSRGEYKGTEFDPHFTFTDGTVLYTTDKDVTHDYYIEDDTRIGAIYQCQSSVASKYFYIQAYELIWESSNYNPDVNETYSLHFNDLLGDGLVKYDIYENEEKIISEVVDTPIVEKSFAFKKSRRGNYVYTIVGYDINNIHVSRTLELEVGLAKIYDTFLDIIPKYDATFNTEYKSQVLTSYTHNEDRVAQRQSPRLSFEYSYDFTDRFKQTGFLEQLRKLSQVSYFHVPNFFFSVKLTELISGEPINVTEYNQFCNEQEVGIYINKSFKEIGTVKIVSNNSEEQIVIETSEDYGECEVVPLHICRITSEPKVNYYDVFVNSIDLSFEQVFPLYKRFKPYVTTFLGHDLLLNRRATETSIELSLTQDIQENDYGIGVTDAFTLNKKTYDTFDFKISCNTEDLFEIYNFLKRRVGKLNAFFTPSYIYPIKLNKQSDYIVYDRIDIRDCNLDINKRSYIIMYTKDNSYCAKVLERTSNEIVIDRELNIPYKNIVSIDSLLFVRLDTDNIRLNYTSYDLLDFNLNVIECDYYDFENLQDEDVKY